MDKTMNWKWVVGHTAIIWFVTLFLGTIVGLCIAMLFEYNVEPQIVQTLFEYASIIGIFASVCVISILQRITWKHLFAVWVLLTLVSFMTAILTGVLFSNVILGVLIIAVVMALANLFSMLMLKLFCAIKKRNLITKA